MSYNEINITDFFVIYLSLFLIGTGPSLFFLRKIYSIGICFFIWAPVIGLTVVTLISTSLVLYGIPVAFWANYLLYLGIVLSLFMVFFLTRKINFSDFSVSFDSIHKNETLRFSIIGVITRKIVVSLYSLNKNQMLCFFTIGIITTLFLILPVFFGGLDFTLFRGNGADAINYMNLAGTLNDVTYGSGAMTPEHMKNPVYIGGFGLFGDRGWAVSVLMALFSDWLGDRIYNFEFLFSLIFLALAYGPSFLLGLQLKIKPLVSAILSSIISTGLWAEFILDNRSQSSLSVIPIILSLVLMLYTLNRKNKFQYDRENILFTLLSSALLILYIEITPIIIMSFCLLLGIEIFKRSIFIKPLVSYYSTALLAGILILFSNSHLIVKLIAQIGYADHGINNWAEYGFVWLYDNLFSGVWGMGIPEGTLGMASIILGIILTLLAINTILFSFISNQTTTLRAICCLAMSGLLVFVYLFTKHQLWAAGKALSYIYPFLIFLPIFSVFSSLLKIKQRKFKVFCQSLIVIYLVYQWCFAVIRIEHAIKKIEFPNRFMVFHPHYRYYNWHVKPLVQAVFDNCSMLAFNMERTGFSVYLPLVFINRIPIENFSPNVTYKKDDCIIMDKKFSLPSLPYSILIDNKDIYDNRRYFLVKIE